MHKNGNFPIISILKNGALKIFKKDDNREKCGSKNLNYGA